MRNQFSEKIENRLKQIHSHEPPPKSANKRKISHLVLLADIILIIAIFFYFTNRDEKTENKSQSVIVNNVQYRVNSSIEAGKMTITTTLQSSENEKEISFNGYIADIFVSYNNNVVSQIKMGEKKESLHLDKMSARNFFITIPVTTLMQEIRKTDSSSIKKRSLFSFFDKGELIYIRVLFNNSENVELSLSFTIKE